MNNEVKEKPQWLPFFSFVGLTGTLSFLTAIFVSGIAAGEVIVFVVTGIGFINGFPAEWGAVRNFWYNVIEKEVHYLLIISYILIFLTFSFIDPKYEVSVEVNKK